MAAGSLTLGGNVSIAVGPLGRNGEAVGTICPASSQLAHIYPCFRCSKHQWKGGSYVILSLFKILI